MACRCALRWLPWVPAPYAKLKLRQKKRVLWGVSLLLLIFGLAITVLTATGGGGVLAFWVYFLGHVATRTKKKVPKAWLRLASAFLIFLFTSLVTSAPWRLFGGYEGCRQQDDSSEFQEAWREMMWQLFTGWVLATVAIFVTISDHAPSTYVRQSCKCVCAIWFSRLVWMMPYLLATCSESSTGRNMGRANFWTQDEVFLFQFTRALAVGLIFLSHVWHLELVYGRLIALQESYGEQLPCTHLIRWLLLSLVPAMSALVPASFLNLKALVLAIASALSTALMISAALFWMAITVPLQDLRSVDRGAASVVQSSDLTYAIGSLWRQRLEILLSITCMAANIAAVALDFMFNTELSNFLQIVALSVDGLWTACCITWLSGIRLNAPRVHKDKEVKKEVQYRQPCTCQEAGSCDGCIWEQNVASLARRQILPGQLLDLYAALGGDGDGTPDPHHLRVSKTQSIVAMVLGAEAMPHFEPERSTTGDVVWQAIIPATASRGRDGCGSSLASLLPAGPADLAPRMVTHHWGNRFVDLVAAVVADALGLNHFDTLAQNLSEDHAGRRSEVNKLKEKLWNRGLGDQPYWICAVCINQHSSICNNPRSFCDTVTGQPVPCCECDTPKILNDQYLQCELNKFDDMMMHLYYVHGSAFVQVLAIDRDFEIFSRAWCLAEMVQADACRMDQHVLLHSPEALEKNSARLVSIRVQDCSATRPEDKEAILSNIGGAREQEQFNDRLRDLLLGAKGLLAKWLDGQTNLQGIGAVAARVKAETRAHEDEDSEEESLGGLPLERTLSAAHAWAQAAFEAATKADAVLTTAGVIAAQARRGETRDLTDTTTSAFFRVRSSSNTERKDLVLAGLADTTSSSPWRIRSEDSMSRKEWLVRKPEDEECLSPASPMRCLQVDTAASSPWCRRDDSESEQEDQTQDLGTEPSADAVAPEFRLSL